MNKLACLALLLTACGGSMDMGQSCSHEFMLCMAGGDDGSTVNWAGTGSEDIATCSARMHGKPTVLTCTFAAR